jgi:hypothetical protein
VLSNNSTEISEMLLNIGKKTTYVLSNNSREISEMLLNIGKKNYICVE